MTDYVKVTQNLLVKGLAINLLMVALAMIGAALGIGTIAVAGILGAAIGGGAGAAAGLLFGAFLWLLLTILLAGWAVGVVNNLKFTTPKFTQAALIRYLKRGVLFIVIAALILTFASIVTLGALNFDLVQAVMLITTNPLIAVVSILVGLVARGFTVELVGRL